MDAPVKQRRVWTRDDHRTVRPELTAYQRKQDEWQRELWKRLGLAIGHWLEARGRLDQPIDRLRLEELEGMAWAALCEYHNARAEKRRELDLEYEQDTGLPDRLDKLLMG